MDAAKKTAIEKRLVIGLAGVFVLTFCLGPLRSLGGSARKAPGTGATPPTDRAGISKILEAVVQRADQKDTRPLAQAAPGVPVYTAQHLRDPLDSLLPSPAELQASRALAQPLASGEAAANAWPASAPVSTASKGPRPTLRVQGLLWGRAEPKAIIEDRVYGIGDQVGVGKVIGIDRRGVTIDYGGESFSYQPSSLTPSAMNDPYHSGSVNQGR